MRFFAFCLIASCAGAAMAQPKQAAFPIHSVKVTGSKLYQEEALVRASGLAPGGAYTEAQLDKVLEGSQKRLLESGAAANVSYRYGPSGRGGYDVTFEVVDYEQRIPYRFEALDIDDAKARSYLKEKEPLYGDLIPASEAIAERLRRHVAEFAKKDVKVRMEPDRDGNLNAVFIPAAGLPSVAEVSFAGNKAVPTTLLQNTIHGVAVGAIWREDRFRELLQTSIVPLYLNRGRVRVKFPKVEGTPLSGTDVLGVAVKVTVEEGPSYNVGAVTVSGTPDNDGLTHESGLKSGNVANYEEIREGQKRLHAALRRLGFMKADSKFVPSINDKTQEVDVHYRVSMGLRYTFVKMDTRGLDLHGEHEVRRLWSMKEGEPFNADYPDYFLARLREDGIFDNLRNTKAVIEPDEAAQTVHVTLVFNEPEKRPVLR
ncbi:MAG: POTRA domain-containing protein [Bryobacteraceae bacterium]